ncbi:MAG: biotin carboxyl carrier protein [Alphaproteobacteria bacterium]
MTDIKLVDVCIRDGNQSIWSAMEMKTAQDLSIAPVMDRVGFHAIDFISSTFMSIAVRYHKEDPWERIRLMRKAMPVTPLQFITTGMRFIAWEASDLDFMRLVYRCLIRNGIRRFIMLDPMHDETALLTSARIMKEEGADEVMAALTYTISEIHNDKFYADLAGKCAASPHFDRLYIKDPAGILTPERARTLIPAVKAKIGKKLLELHSHCTIGLSVFNYMVGAELGIDVLHTAVGPLANGSSLPSATRLIANLREMGHKVDIDEHALQQMTDYFTELAEAEELPIGSPQEFDASFMRHQLAGGVMTTTRRQLAELKLEHKMPELIEEVERVRAELGYPIMVTPFPQIVCTQALFNVIGAERYAQVPDQVIRYVVKRFGRPTSPVDKEIEAKILDRPRAREIEKEPPILALDDLKKRLPKGLSDEEFLLRAVMPADQVDAMIAAGPAKRAYSPGLRKVARLIEKSNSPTAKDDLVIEKPGFKATLKRTKAAAHA